MPEKADNAPEVSVSELSSALKRTIEDRFGYVRVRGEVSGWRGPHSSGHVYFCLKDQGARIDAVIWKGAYQRLRVKPEEGMEVIATGKITTYPGKSTYQIVVETIEPAGVGALLAQLEERRRRLAAEGLFDEARKQLPPHMPRVLGVVTSPTGAVIRDILHRVADRFPMRVLVWPVRVQGDTCPAEVARAIRGFNALPEDGPIPRPDVLIVARGGGSLEDLWGFNDEIVVRAAAESMIPLVSAVGHETDWTLIDHAADRRAPTPTAAAEMTVPVRSELLAQTAALVRRLEVASARFAERARADLRALARALPSADDVLAAPRQRLDRAGELLPARAEASLSARRTRLSRLGALVARHAPDVEIARRRGRFESAARVLARAFEARVRAEGERCAAQHERIDLLQARMRRAVTAGAQGRGREVESLAKLLVSLSHKSVLARGFALVRDGAATGAPVCRAGALSAGQGVTLEFADGAIGATIIGAPGETPPETPGETQNERPHEPPRRGRRAPVRPPARVPDGARGQGSLF